MWGGGGLRSLCPGMAPLPPATSYPGPPPPSLTSYFPQLVLLLPPSLPSSSYCISSCFSFLFLPSNLLLPAILPLLPRLPPPSHPPPPSSSSSSSTKGCPTQGGSWSCSHLSAVKLQHKFGLIVSCLFLRPGLSSSIEIVLRNCRVSNHRRRQ